MDGETKRDWLEDDLLYFKEGRLFFVSSSRGLRRKLTKETHDSQVGKSSGTSTGSSKPKLLLLKMEKDFEVYV